MKDINILITSSGRRVSLLRSFKDALTSLNLGGSVFSADLKVDAPTSQVSDKHWIVPHVTDKQYISVIQDLCVKNNISLVVPTIDTELHILSAHKASFNNIGVTVLVCSNDVNEISFDKYHTQDFFQYNDIPCPAMYSLNDAKKFRQDQFPLLLKPAKGSSSVGVTIINNQNELHFFSEYIKEPIIQELVKGDEYTLDVLVGFDGKTRCIVPRLRVETRAGEVSKAITVRDGNLIEQSRKFVDKLKGAVGCVTLQCFYLLDGSVKFIEINPRFGGGFPLSARAGANFPRWILQMLLNIPEDHDMQNQWEDGLVMLRYDEEILVKKTELYQ